jgi:hypothetical protein
MSQNKKANSTASEAFKMNDDYINAYGYTVDKEIQSMASSR